MDLKETYKRQWKRYVVAIALITLGIGLRIWPLGGLGLRIPYVTFYPTAGSYILEAHRTTLC